jgi:Domain of unknown function (DUF6268)
MNARNAPGAWVKGMFTALAIVGTAAEVDASIDDLVQAFAASEIKLSRVENDVPMPPLGWMQQRFYSSAEFSSYSGANPPGSFRQHETGVGLFLPAYIGRRDLVLAGLDASRDVFDFKSGSARDIEVLTLTPATGWLHQLNPDSQIGAFLAPMFSSAHSGSGRWGAQAFAGVLATHQARDSMTLIYGAVYEYSFGSHRGYPYLGLNWLPDRHWAVALIVPWPAISYAPTDRFFLQLGAQPGGTAWRLRADGEEAAANFGSWNLSASFGWRLANRLWLSGSAGFAGLRSFEVSDRQGTRLEAEINGCPVFNLALQFRP